MSGEIILHRRRFAKSAPPPCRSHQTHRRGHSIGTIFPPKRRLHCVETHTPPPQAVHGYSRRAKLPPARAFSVPVRQRFPEQAPPAARIGVHQHRRRVISAATPAIPVRRRGEHLAHVPPGIAASMSVRRRLPGSGLDATKFIVPRHRAARGLRTPPPGALVGHRRRERITGGRPVLIPHRRAARLPHGVPAALLRPHSAARHRWLATGAVPGNMVVRRRLGRRWGMTPAQLRGNGKRRIRSAVGTAGDAPPGPWFFEAMDVWSGGVEQGDVKEG